ncbi:MAG TPA: transposase [Alphaproteobacteria bacterium]|nr:transposase [Alphaproteobacteria bacterium]
MDIDRDSGQLYRLEVVETGRRRRWTPEEKIRIVEESLAGDRQASSTARRYGIANSLLFKWRKAYRAGQLGASWPTPGFVPALVMPDAPAPVSSGAGGRMEIVIEGGRRVIVGADVDAAALARVLAVLERR